MTQPLQPAGVQAVVVNLNGFLADLGRMNTGMIQMGDIAVKVTNKISASGQAFGGMHGNIDKSITGIIGSFNSMGGAVSRVAGGTLGFFSNLASVAGGFLARDIIGKLAGKFKEWSNTIADAATELQLLNVRLDNLIGLQLRAADTTMTYEQSMEKVKGVSRELLVWMEKLSFATPFNIDQVSNANTLLLAMGFTIDETKNLTKAIMDFVAGAGLPMNETMGRIIYNLAQMKTQGKVTSTELRDLARGAFVPVDMILRIAAKNMGVAAEGMQEFREAASEGKISVDEFFKAFIQFAGESFPDAAAKMNFTMTALKDNLEDFFKIQIGWNVFGETVAKAADILNQFFQGLITEDATFEFKLLGKAVLDAFNTFVAVAQQIKSAITPVLDALGIRILTVTEFIRRITYAIAGLSVIFEAVGNIISGFITRVILPFAQSLRDRMGGSLAETANRAFSWGANIVINLAEGMIRAAAAALKAAMNFIAKLFTSWLAPGSPPKILPELNKWGAQAFAEYLRGFTMADFSELDSVQNALKGSLGALADLGQFGEEGDKRASELFKSLSKDLIQAMAEFNKTGVMSESIFKKLSAIGGGFGRELSDLLRKQVALNQATERYAAAEKALKDAQAQREQATGKVNKAIREYNAMLRAGADKAALKNKLKEVNAAEQALDAAREKEKLAAEEEKAAKDALAPLKEAVDLQEKLIQQLIELAKAEADAREGAGDGGGGDKTVPPVEVPPIDMGGVGGGVEDALDKTFEDIKKQMRDRLKALWEDIRKVWNEKFQPIIDDLSTKFGPAIQGFLGWWESTKTKLETIWGNLSAFWNEHGGKIMETLGKIAGVLLGTLGGLALRVIDWLLDKLVILSEWFKENGPTIEKALGNIGLFFGWVGTKVLEAWSWIKPILDLLFMELLSLADIVVKVLAGDWSGAWETMKKATVDGLGLIWNAIGNFLKWLGIDPAKVWESLVTTIGTAWDTIKTTTETTWNDITSSLSLSWENLKTWASDTWTSIETTISDIWTSITGTVETSANAVYTSITTWIGDAKQWIEDQVSAWGTAGENLIGGLVSGITSQFEAVKNAITTLINNAVAAAKKALGIESPSKVFAKIGKNMMAGLALGIGNGVAMPEVAVTQAMQATTGRAQMTAAAPVISHNSVNFGDINVNNGMDYHLLLAVIRQTIREEL